jgi:hypothetical protein
VELFARETVREDDIAVMGDRHIADGLLDPEMSKDFHHTRREQSRLGIGGRAGVLFDEQ